MKFITSIVNWLDSDYFPEGQEQVRNGPVKMEIGRCVPFLFLHLGCIPVFYVGCSSTAVTTCVLLYIVRMFAVTGFYHRYFSHRSFKTTRAFQFVMAAWGLMSVQRGPLWWAAHHRTHHRKSDHEGDIHSPKMSGFLWSHIGWITSSNNMPTNYSNVQDLARYPELVFLNRFDWIVPSLLFIGLYAFGEMLRSCHPELHTNGAQLIVWGFFISSVILFHATASINSLSHIFGSQRYDTGDDSRNNFILALITFGEGWHNNHHKYRGTVRQGFYWWEIDLTYYGLLILSLLGLISDLHPVPAEAYLSAQNNSELPKQEQTVLKQ
ncbi:MAG: acyl-CoA desaturase [Candidatus Obscuribacterales bacterium]|nr:acyl-CoA desaturase [Candidatus Obscuribacterales bacterium]